ncbi:amino acid adenylation domain-containing protein [Actinomadura sp. KC216]|uniref:non-ribosomal peptide synthetase n=1 Tax=Actinomadura sp. KC216 TaxID=2530370 RepID=UPI00104E24C1|nr:non-ribosomal peptide synthetase [Actinomadura sp. KC216]TDB90609.1 amino acid adenylation domain-containing protein [Actinomadura sp. KC216]
MDRVNDLLADLSRRGVDLWVDGDELHCRAPKNALTASLRTAMQDQKQALIAALRERSATPPTAIGKIEPAPDRLHLPFPLSDMQQALFAGQRDAFEIGNLSGNGYVEFDTVALDWDRFTWAWKRMLERHHMLRCIVLPDGHNQILPDVPEYRIEELDLRGRPAAEVTAKLDELRRTMPQETFRPDRWPLFRLRAVRLDDDRRRFHLASSLMVADSLSLQILFKDLARLYAGEELPPLELSNRDYIVAKAELKGTPVHDRALDYWRRRLPTLPPPPELPIEIPRSTESMPSVALSARLLEPEPWARMKERAKEEGLMVGAVLLTAFSDVIAAWSKTPEFSLNAPFWDRLPVHDQVNQIVGSFALPNHLAVRALPDSTFLERARRLQRQLVEDLEHCRYVSGVQVMRELAKAHGGTPRRNTYVVFNSVEMSSVDVSALGTPGYTVSQTPQVYLEARSAERNGALEFTWDILEPVFPPGLARDMLDAFARHVRRLAEEPGGWEERSRRHIVPEAQRARQREVNATAAALPGGLLHAPFMAQAARRPEQPAVMSTAGRLTYGDLDRRSTRLGRRLREQGAVPNSLVGVVMEKGWEQVVAVLGVLKAGAAYLPLDATLPQERLHHILENAEAGIVLTQRAVDERFDWPAGVRRLCVDTQPLDDVSEEPLEPVQGEGDLAYVIYTSGSTGRPKGVMISHRAALNTVADVNRRFGIEHGDRVLGLSALSFDLSVHDVFGTLAAGGTLVLPDVSGLLDPQHWLELMRRDRVTVWNSVPGFMQMLVEYAEGVGTAVPGSLRLALLSGDWIPVGLPGRLRRLAPGVRMISLGGATEASIWSILHPIEDVDPDRPSIPYGKPMANQQVHVLDHELDMRPDWVPGDLYIGGVGLAEGYWRDEEATRAAFIVHPGTGERLYRTGDIGRRLPDGAIELLGREDFQVKVGGYRIELGEIEKTLREHQAVGDAIAIAADEEGGGKRLVAYVVAANDARPGTSELRTFVRDKLPEYMVPKNVVLLDEMPLTANGKVDRAALAARDLPAAPAAGRGPVAPRTPLERQLAGLWTDVLGAAELSIYDSFFDLSDDSLQAVNLVSKISELVGKQIGVRYLFAHPTIAELSAALGAPTDGQGASAEALAGSANGEQGHGGVSIERRDLLTLFASGRAEPVEGAAILALPAGLFERAGLDPTESKAAIDNLGGLPMLVGVITTQLGRIAAVMIPRLDTAELYLDREGLVGTILEGIEMAGRLGAGSASLSGLLVSATEYGQAVANALEQRTDLPRVTSGHDTTAASVLLVVEAMLRHGGRRIEDEVLCSLGVGSVGRASLELMLRHLPHPRELMLCDPYAQRGSVEQVAEEVRDTFGYRGEIRVIGATAELPDEFYEATLISADTNAPDIVDVARLRPGAILVDDSIPPCYDRDAALARAEERADVLFAQGDVVRAKTPMGKVLYWPPAMTQMFGAEGIDEFIRSTPDASSPVDITSSVLSSLLVERVEGIEPTVGPADPDRCVKHLETLRGLGFDGGAPQCDGIFLSEGAVTRFREQFGVTSEQAAAPRP